MRLSTRHCCTGLCLAISLCIKRLLVYGDSLLVDQQVNKEWDINKDTMDAYVMKYASSRKVLGVGNSPCDS
jgi:hypothetical protein